MTARMPPGFEDSDHDDGQIPFTDRLRGMLSAELDRHQPDSHHIRRRVAARTGDASLATVVHLVRPDTVPDGRRGDTRDHPQDDLPRRVATPGRASFAPVAWAGSTQTAPSTGPWTTSAASTASATSTAPAAAARVVGQAATTAVQTAGAPARHPARLITRGPRRRGGGRSRSSPRTRRRGAFVGALLVAVGVMAGTAVALLTTSGSNAPDPPSATISAKPRPSGSPAVASATPKTPTRPPRDGTTMAPAPSTGPGAGPPWPDSASAAGPTRPRGSSSPTAAHGGRAGAGGTATAAGSSPTTLSDRPGGIAGEAASDAIYTSSVAPLPSGSRVQLPALGTQDWVLFGPSWNGVTERDATPTNTISTSVPLGLSTLASSGFDWTGGIPLPTGSDKTDRLSVHGNAQLSVFAGTTPLTLDLYLGSDSGQIQLNVVSIAGTRTFVQRLPSPVGGGSADGMVSIGIPAGAGLTSVTITAGGLTGWSLAAAALH